MPLVVVDSYYYGKLVVAPLNIVLYNVFTSHGPDLYGEFKITRRKASRRTYSKAKAACKLHGAAVPALCHPMSLSSWKSAGHCRLSPCCEFSCCCSLSSSVNRCEVSQRHSWELLVANVSGCYASAVGIGDTCVCLSALIEFLVVQNLQKVGNSAESVALSVHIRCMQASWVHAVLWESPCLLAVYGLSFAGKQNLRLP